MTEAEEPGLLRGSVWEKMMCLEERRSLALGVMGLGDFPPVVLGMMVSGGGVKCIVSSLMPSPPLVCGSRISCHTNLPKGCFPFAQGSCFAWCVAICRQWPGDICWNADVCCQAKQRQEDLPKRGGRARVGSRAYWGQTAIMAYL